MTAAPQAHAQAGSRPGDIPDCLRYRPATRQAQAVDTSTCHLGFRCILRDATAPR